MDEGQGGSLQMKDKVQQDTEDQTSDKEEGEIDQQPALGDDGEVISKAKLFYDTIKQRADVNTIVGESIVTFKDLLCLTPR